MKKLILIVACLGIIACGSSSNAEAYTQTGLSNWNAGDTAYLHFNIPTDLDALSGAWLSISAITPMGSNNYVKMNGSDIGVLTGSSNGVLHSTKLNITDYFTNHLLLGQPLDVSIYADGPLSLGPSMLTLEYAYIGSVDPPNGNNAPVPEPATLLLLGSGLSGLAFWGKRRRVAAA